MKFRSITPLLLAALLTLGFLALFERIARAPALAAPRTATWYVAPGGDDLDDCQSPATACATIAAAVDKALDGDAIQIAAGLYNEHDIEVFKALTISGAGPQDTIIDAGGAGRVFYTGSTVTLAGMRLQNGQTSPGNLFSEGGGAVLASGSLTISNTVIVGNHAVGSGGAVFNLGGLALENTQVLSNTADGLGGGIYNYNLGVITVSHSTLAHNTAVGIYGGGIYAGGAGLSVYSSTLADNSAGSFGGGLTVIMDGPALLQGVTLTGNQAASGAALFSQQGAITATNLTVSGNNATNNYGGIYITGPAASLFLQNSTLANNTRTNTAGNGFNGIISGDSASVSLLNTLLAYNQENNCSSFSPPVSLGHNLSSDFTCGLSQPGDLPGVDPLLAPLGDYGGPLLTHALRPGSPAIDAGDPAQCPVADARGVSRPYDGDGDLTAVCDIGAVEARRQASILGSSILEGDSGSASAVFTVTLAPAHSAPIVLSYATQDGSAAGGVDYTPAASTLAFDPGQTEKTLSISVTGDTDDEPDETFSVQLFTAAEIDLLVSQATGVIIDDDGLPSLVVADASILEGNSGSSPLQFEVTLSPASSSLVSVEYGTLNGTALSGSDYTSAGGVLTFQPGQTSQMVQVDVLGDVIDEGLSEAFAVLLSNPVNAGLADEEAAGTITDDDSARLTQGVGPEVLEGDSGFTPAVFTVTLSTPAAFVVAVDYGVSSGFGSTGAVAGQDFVPITGTLTFQPGEAAQAFTVQVIGDALEESDEIFWSLISNANVPIDANGSSAVILNDDGMRLFLPLVRR